MLTFDEARRVVQADDKHRPVDGEGRPYPVARCGWENDDVYVVPFDYGDDTPLNDEPARLVHKRTGRLAFRNPSELPPELRPVT